MTRNVMTIDRIRTKEDFEEWFLDSYASDMCGIFDKRDLPDVEWEYIEKFETITGIEYDSLPER